MNLLFTTHYRQKRTDSQSYCYQLCFITETGKNMFTCGYQLVIELEKYLMSWCKRMDYLVVHEPSALQRYHQAGIWTGQRGEKGELER